MKNLKKMKWFSLVLAGLVMPVDAADVSNKSGKAGAVHQISSTPWEGEEHLKLTSAWDKTFPESDKVDHTKVTFHNRSGITLAADLYMPKNRQGRMPALAVAGPFGAVKEQAAGIYAKKLAEMGFITMAFDPSFIGESGGNVRNVASPDINTEDFCAAVDYLSNRSDVNPDKIGILGICGFGGVVDPLPEDAPQFVKDYHAYYKGRAYHPSSPNSNDGWNTTSALSFTNMPLLSYADEIENPVLIIHGEKAHSRYFSEEAFRKLKGNNKELLIVPGANHTDLYDNMNKIPLDKIAAFFHKYLG